MVYFSFIELLSEIIHFSSGAGFPVPGITSFAWCSVREFSGTKVQKNYANKIKIKCHKQRITLQIFYASLEFNLNL